MAMELFRMYGSILIDDKKAIDTLNKADKKAKDTSTRFEKMGKMAKSAGKWIGAGMAAGTTALFGMAKKAADATDRVDKMSQKIGISRQGFQEWVI